MRKIDWDSHAKHRSYVVQSHGQWIGLLDEDWIPIMDVPPVVELSAPMSGLAPASLKMVVATRTPEGHTHPIVDELVADQLASPAADGMFTPVFNLNRFVAIERAGHPRRCFRITHVVARGVDQPTTLEIHAVDEIDVLASIPCPSYPGSWKNERKQIDRDWAQMWDKPLTMARVQFGKSADGFTVHGPAISTITELIIDSLEAFFRAAGIDDDPIVVAVGKPGLQSPEVLITPQDDSILETIEKPCQQAGVKVTVRLWWPGDKKPYLPGDKQLTLPTMVVTVSRKGA